MTDDNGLVGTTPNYVKAADCAAAVAAAPTGTTITCTDEPQTNVPADPATLSSGDWSSPIVVSPEIGGDCRFSDFVVQQGSYPAVAPGGDIYVAWEKNIDSNLYGGPDPYVYIMAAHIPSGGSAPDTTGPRSPGSQVLRKRPNDSSRTGRGGKR